jgi:membrane protein
MSIVPLTFWLTLLLGKLPVNMEDIFSLPVFASVKDVLYYVQKEAQTATASVSIVLLVTTLYSSTTLFYQMRRSGEIIYEYKRPKKGLKLRLAALVLLLIVMALVLVYALVLALGTFLFSRILHGALERLAEYALLITLSFGLVLLLNAYLCPYKMPIKHFIKGTVFTVAAWAAAVVGFSIYLRVGNMDRLYGALSAVIVFLLWLYVLMICFIIGVIFNSEKIIPLYKAARKKEKSVHKKHKTAQTV